MSYHVKWSAEVGLVVFGGAVLTAVLIIVRNSTLSFLFIAVIIAGPLVPCDPGADGAARSLGGPGGTVIVWIRQQRL